MTHRPNTHTVLEALKEAGKTGMLSREIARRFPLDDERAALSETNLHLNRALRAGRARRGGKEPARSPAGRKSRMYRWYITDAGIDYLTPKPLPEVTQLPETPNSRRVLELLKEAGDEGMLGGVLARHFTIPDPHTPSLQGKMAAASQNLQRRLAWTNQVLDRFLRHGFVRRGGKEPTPYYNNVPVYRWYITPEGVEYLAAGMAAGIRAARIARAKLKAEQNREARRRADDLITQAYVDCDPSSIYKCEREKMIRELREAGCTLDAIGGVFGVTRERVRQILIGYKALPCECPRCAGQRWFEAGDDEVG
jgi:hypothetical protein